MAKFPTINGTLRILREIGVGCKYNSDYHEFVIWYKGDANSAYYTDSRHDALFTARMMQEQKVK